MEYRLFESRVLELLYKTDLRVVAPLAAFRIGCSVAEAQRFLEQMTTAGVLTMEVDDDGVIYYEVPGRPPPTGEPLSWTAAASQGAQASPQPQTALQPYSPSPLILRDPPVITGSEKSVGAAVALSILFGPLGMMYSTVAGGLIMLLATFVIVPLTLGLGFLALWPIEVIWAASAASSHNKKIQAQIAASRQHQLDLHVQTVAAAQAHAASAQAHAAIAQAHAQRRDPQP